MSGSPAIRRVLIVAKTGPPQGVEIAIQLAAWLTDHGMQVLLDEDVASALGRKDGVPRDRLDDEIDLAVVAGGDGTLLSVARAAAPRGIPILGINLGSLGFLTELQPSEALRGLAAVVAGQYTIECRSTLRVRYDQAGAPRREFALLNDVVITKSALARMIVLDVRADDEAVATYTSDGLIVATPTGSTAYNLSAGGPILDPRLSAFIISPICPHSMTYRPLVIPNNLTIDIALRSEDEEVFLTLDGQIGYPFRPDDRLRVDHHPDALQLVRVAGRGFFEILRRKLRWGER